MHQLVRNTMLNLFGKSLEPNFLFVQIIYFNWGFDQAIFILLIAGYVDLS